MVLRREAAILKQHCRGALQWFCSHISSNGFSCSWSVSHFEGHTLHWMTYRVLNRLQSRLKPHFYFLDRYPLDQSSDCEASGCSEPPQHRSQVYPAERLSALFWAFPSLVVASQEISVQLLLETHCLSVWQGGRAGKLKGLVSLVHSCDSRRCTCSPRPGDFPAPPDVDCISQAVFIIDISIYWSVLQLSW